MSANRNNVDRSYVSDVACGSLLRSHTYAYEGWNLILERIAYAGGATDEIEYFWGSDLSGGEQGAGGVGGLVALSINGAFYFPCYDNNGNIIAYVDESGSLAAQFVYDAFGNPLATDNSELATLFSFRFSTKYLDPETGFYYYGYRHYAPDLGRWLTRDPIEEQGGLNLYGFCGNDGVNEVDRLGLFPLTRDLEIELDYKKISLGTGASFFAKTWARGQDILEITGAKIIQVGQCCAKVKNAARHKMTIHAFWLSENEIGQSVTSSGYDAVISHEQKRGAALISGFIAYYGPVSGRGVVATKCGTVCSKAGFEDAKQQLMDYMGSIAIDAWSQFYEYSLSAQGSIGRESGSNMNFIEVNGKSLFNNFKQTFSYQPPAPFKESTPCPKSN